MLIIQKAELVPIPNRPAQMTLDLELRSMGIGNIKHREYINVQKECKTCKSVVTGEYCHCGSQEVWPVTTWKLKKWFTSTNTDGRTIPGDDVNVEYHEADLLNKTVNAYVYTNDKGYYTIFDSVAEDADPIAFENSKAKVIKRFNSYIAGQAQSAKTTQATKAGATMGLGAPVTGVTPQPIQPVAQTPIVPQGQPVTQQMPVQQGQAWSQPNDNIPF